ncbi:MAG TPA: hypothetical protein VEJ46_05250 [Candidatus Acidoferrum sp.]|nr:hypothetical protein [Candidatus Acidoferrum sp.]
MTFWAEVLANFLGAVFAGSLFVLLYRLVLWFLRATDVIVGYNWSWEGTQFHPNFDIRNRSWTKQYLLANIAYTRNNGKEVVWFDNKSIWDAVLPPSSIRHFDNVAPVPKITSRSQCLELEITVRLQTGRLFWLKGQGPSQLCVGKLQHAAFWLREKIERSAIPFEG